MNERLLSVLRELRLSGLAETLIITHICSVVVDNRAARSGGFPGRARG
jgi:hypothetical protein